jgi:hypothetical protein
MRRVRQAEPSVRLARVRVGQLVRRGRRQFKELTDAGGDGEGKLGAAPQTAVLGNDRLDVNCESGKTLVRGE